MLKPDEADRARQGIADTLASIEAGELDASAEQRAYLRGAADTLKAVAEPEKSDSV